MSGRARPWQKAKELLEFVAFLGRLQEHRSAWATLGVLGELDTGGLGVG